MTALDGSAARLTIFIGEFDKWQLSPIHTTHLFSLSNHLPVVIIIVDDRTRIQSFLYRLDEILDKGMVLLDNVEVIRYQPEPGLHGNRSHH